MPKKKALIRIENKEEKKEIETNVIIENNIIKYRDDKAITKIDLNIPSITRDNKEYKIVYTFSENKKTIGTITIKDIKNVIDVEIITNKIMINDDNIEIEYKMNNEKFLFKMEVMK